MTVSAGLRACNNRLLASVTALICCLLLLLAVPRFIASVYALYPEALSQRMKQPSNHQSDNAYTDGIAALDKAISWFETSDYRQMQALFELARSVDVPSRNSNPLQQARQATARGLMLLPVDPFAWYRLASIDASLGAAPQEVIRSLRLSIYAGAVEPELLLPRMSLSYAYKDSWDDEIRDLIKAQIRFAWKFRKVALTEFAATHHDALPLLQEALISSPDDWNRFLQNFERVIQKTDRTAPEVN